MKIRILYKTHWKSVDTEFDNWMEIFYFM